MAILICKTNCLELYQCHLNQWRTLMETFWRYNRFYLQDCLLWYIHFIHLKKKNIRHNFWTKNCTFIVNIMEIEIKVVIKSYSWTTWNRLVCDIVISGSLIHLMFWGYKICLIFCQNLLGHVLTYFQLLKGQRMFIWH